MDLIHSIVIWDAGWTFDLDTKLNLQFHSSRVLDPSQKHPKKQAFFETKFAFKTDLKCK